MSTYYGMYPAVGDPMGLFHDYEYPWHIRLIKSQGYLLIVITQSGFFTAKRKIPSPFREPEGKNSSETASIV